jgi:hypothetical protein
VQWIRVQFSVEQATLDGRRHSAVLLLMLSSASWPAAIGRQWNKVLPLRTVKEFHKGGKGLVKFFFRSLHLLAGPKVIIENFKSQEDKRKTTSKMVLDIILILEFLHANDFIY